VLLLGLARALAWMLATANMISSRLCKLKHMPVVSLCVIVSSLTVSSGGNGFNSQHVTAIDPKAAGNLDRTQVTIRSVSELLTVRLFKPGR